MKIEREFAGAQLGDERLNKRLVQLAKSFETWHGGAISFSCGDWKSAKAAYRFFDNARFSEQEVWQRFVHGAAISRLDNIYLP